MGEDMIIYKVLLGKPEGKRPLGRPNHRWEDGIKMDLTEIGWGSVEWIQVAQDRDRWRALVNTMMNFRSDAMELVRNSICKLSMNTSFQIHLPILRAVTDLCKFSPSTVAFQLVASLLDPRFAGSNPA
jgi:hypothetical protein